MSKKLKGLIVDDEQPSREILNNYIVEFCDQIEVIGTASSIKSAYKSILRLKPDVVFLDIELKDGKGFDLLTMFDKIDFRVIFITAYSDYAIKAFRVNAADYLLKPVKIDELKSAVEKIVTASEFGYEDKIASVLKSINESKGYQPTLVVPNLKGFEVLRLNEIILCKADGYCTNFHLEGSRKIISSRNLKQYEAILPGDTFLRVHNSYIINLNHVTGYNRQGEIMLNENQKAFLGDSFRTIFLTRFSRK